MTTADQPAGATSRVAANRAAKRAPGKWRSWETTEGAIRAPHRSMMRAMGLSDRDIDQPFVGVASTHNEVTPCNIGIAPLVEQVKAGVSAADGTPFMFGVITVSDAISMGTEGMKGSLVSARSSPTPSRRSALPSALTAWSRSPPVTSPSPAP